MRVNIIFHSISGNLYIIASAFKEALEKEGFDARIYKIEDPDLHLLAAERNDVNEYYEEIESLPRANNEKLRSADVIMLGTHSAFGMPTAEMMSFIDQTEPLFETGELAGKLFYPFATSQISYRDALKAVDNLENWADLMGLECIDFPPYTHEDGYMTPGRPGNDLVETASRLASTVSLYEMIDDEDGEDGEDQ